MNKRPSQDFANSYSSGAGHTSPAFNNKNKVEQDYAKYMSQFNKKDYGMQTDEDKMKESYSARPGYASGYSYDKYKSHIGAMKKRMDMIAMNKRK